MTVEVVYDDGGLSIDTGGITIRRYYFPLATSRRVDAAELRGVQVQPMGWSTGRGRGWGSTHPHYWMPLDLSRPRKTTMLVLQVTGRVHPAVTPDQPREVAELIRGLLLPRST